MSKTVLKRTTSLKPTSLTTQSKPEANLNNTEQNLGSKTEPKPGAVTNGRKIVIVVDLSLEAKNALQWALSQCVQKEDSIVLLHVAKSSKQVTGESSKERTSRAYELVYPLKNLCQLKKPEIKTEIAVIEGEEKGPSVVEEAKRLGAGLLVMGQRKQALTWRILMFWAVNGTTGNEYVEYCINNSECMAIAVRSKSKRHGGGYLITTKHHRDFWLLA